MTPVPLAERMKTYEQTGNTPLIPTLPILARLDGKCFHSFARGLAKPYDVRLHDLMVLTTQHLVRETCARVGYTQSDEISLLWQADTFGGETFMAGDRSKMISLLAAMATAVFGARLPEYIPEKSNLLPLFDCRVWNVPDRTEAANCFVWREQDATRNSIQAAGQAYFSHNRMHGMTCNQIQEALWREHDVNWNDYPAWSKRGTYVQRRRSERAFTADELDTLPPKHEARMNPGLIVSRVDVVTVDMPALTKIVNRVGVLFYGEDAATRERGDANDEE